MSYIESLSRMVDHPFPEDFEQNVGKCLTYLFEFTPLQDDPIAELLAPNSSGLDRVQIVRKRIIDAIEQLRQGTALNEKNKQQRIFSLLNLRYIEGVSSQAIVQQLAISERQYYRDRQRAITSLCYLLWKQIHTEATLDANQSISIQSEVERIVDSPTGTMATLDSMLSAAVHAVSVLADRYNIQITVHPASLEHLQATQPMILRQAVIWLLSQLIIHAESEAVITLELVTKDNNDLLIFETVPQHSATLIKYLEAHETLAHFCQTLKATISNALIEDRLKVKLQLSAHRQTILVVDDNPDAIGLFQRYLANQSYTVKIAHRADVGLQLAQKLQPVLIILDIMLPDQDGWETLQNLKNHPQTQDIPVLVCSVLDMPELALSLGADGYLQKPPGRSEFIQALVTYVR